MGPPSDDLWVFAYGSLMWRPDFPYLERLIAHVYGWRRRLCIFSVHYRGTERAPGLVLGLDRGGSCRGVAFRVAADEKEAVHDYLRRRELISAVYLERSVEAALEDGRRVKALAYVADRAHVQYAGQLTRAETLKLVRQGVGRAGRDTDYVLATHDHLSEMGVNDVELAWLSRQLRESANT